MILELLKKFVPFKEIGWTEIGEVFYRFQLLKTPWFNLYLHRLYAPNWHGDCHDHPWSFWTLILFNGYLEQVGSNFFRRRALSAWFRPAKFAHNVITPYGPAWSLILTTKKTRDWKFVKCEA